MKHNKKRCIVIFLSGFFLLGALVYLAVFGRALMQEEDHLSIALALPKTIISGGVTSVNSHTYLAPDTAVFLEYMKERGFVHIEQLGSAHFFEKSGVHYLVSGRMYSAYFMVFSIFLEENN